MQVLFLCSVPNVSTFGTNKAIIKDFPVFLVTFASKSKSVYYFNADLYEPYDKCRVNINENYIKLKKHRYET